MEIKDLYKIYLQHPSIKIDTRKLVPGDIFFALKGPILMAIILQSKRYMPAQLM
jgi:hypothetical protein